MSARYACLRSSVLLEAMKPAVLIFLVLLAAPLSALAQTDIRDVDFKNFRFKLSCGSADSVSLLKVTDGKYRGTKSSLKDVVSLQINEVKYGDLNNDGKEEAVVLYSCGSGASYVYFRGLIFSIRNKKPRLIAEVEGGNKGDGGFYEVSIFKNRLIVQRYQVGTGGSACCPAFIETTKYRLRGRKLYELGKGTLRKIPSDAS